MIKPPKCHWPECGREMFLLNESPDFWMWACGCGCTRAVSKPSAREKSLYDKEMASAERNRQVQRIREAKRLYSIPSKVRIQ